jgi:ApbE superfamily uncharacterized protein (UPF0280 family)
MVKLFKETFQVKDSKGTIVADRETALKTAVESIQRHRTQLETYIDAHPQFEYTLKPYPPPPEPQVARLMAQAAAKAGVGPMAAVAGVLADLAVKDMLAEGCKVAVVEDGGEVSAVSDTPVDIAVAIGEEPLSRRFGFRLTEFPIGVATSSGRFSHAFSFGDAEAATVFAGDAGLADAAATAVCNVVKGEDWKAAIECGINVGKSISGVEGVMIIYKGNVGTWGKIPQIIKIEPQPTANL